MGTLSSSDGIALEQLCLLYSLIKRADAEVAKPAELGGGLTVIGSHGGPIAHPCVAIARNARTQLQRLQLEFGLTPASRTRVRADNADGKPQDNPQEKADAFLFDRPARVVGRIGA